MYPIQFQSWLPGASYHPECVQVDCGSKTGRIESKYIKEKMRASPYRRGE
jgi:hypothetical protein